MTICDTYVGNLSDSEFKWEGGDWNGNFPARLTEFFPPYEGKHYGVAMHDWMKEKGLVYRQTDFGTWVAKATKAEVMEFFEAAYARRVDLSWMEEKWAALRRSLMDLPEGVTYGLVNQEF